MCLGGVPGVGKTKLLHLHKANHPMDCIVSGSSVLREVAASAGMSFEGFDHWTPAAKLAAREAAIARLHELRDSCEGRLLVDGHFTLRNPQSATLERVFTPGDRSFYGALVLVEAPANDILKWRAEDRKRVRISERHSLVESHLSAERIEACRLSNELGLPMISVDSRNIDESLRSIGAFLDQHAPLDFR